MAFFELEEGTGRHKKSKHFLHFINWLHQVLVVACKLFLAA